MLGKLFLGTETLTTVYVFSVTKILPLKYQDIFPVMFGKIQFIYDKIQFIYPAIPVVILPAVHVYVFHQS